MDRIIVRVLGTAQDAGVPHIGCRCPRCERARREPRFSRKAACLAIQNPVAGLQYLVDATPDVRDQIDWLLANGGQDRTGRPPVDGILLTHAHIGHYTGLVQFGREAMATRNMPVWCTPAMAEFLAINAPWSLLVRLGNVELRPEFRAGQPCRPDPGFTVTPLPVPHRNEFTDTVCFRIEGPSRSLLYLPDIDRWEQWDRDLKAEVAAVDVAILDGCFYSGDELRARGRDPREVPHPPMLETMDLLQDLVHAGKTVYFTHLNHTNPALEEGSPERAHLEARGFRVLTESLKLVI